MTVQVARIVGFPTSSTAFTACVHADTVKLEMPVDVLDDDDGIVDEDADGEDEGKEGHPVERVAIEVVDEQRQGERHRNRHGHDDGLARTEGQRDQDDDGDRRDEHVLEQLIGLVLRRLAVISRHRDVHIRGDEVPPERIDLRQCLACHDAGVGAFFLRDGDGDGLVLPGGVPGDPLARTGGPEAHEDVIARLLGAVLERGHVLQVDRPSVMDAHDDAAHLVDAVQQTPRVDENLAVLRGVGA